jgi:hypothetical protein
VELGKPWVSTRMRLAIFKLAYDAFKRSLGKDHQYTQGTAEYLKRAKDQYK